MSGRAFHDDHDDDPPEWTPEESSWRPDPADLPAWRPDSERDEDEDVDHKDEPVGKEHAYLRRPPRAPHGEGPAYLAAMAVVVVSFGLALLTVGIHGEDEPWVRTILLSGLAVLLTGFGMLGLAAWLVGGLEPARRPHPPRR